LNSITISTPFFNETDAIENYYKILLKILKRIKKKYIKIIWINDGSTDDTLKKLIKKKKKLKNINIKIINHKENFGYGKTLHTSIKFCKTKYLITYDSDCTYSYKIINKLIYLVNKKNFDCVNVSYKLSNNNDNLNHLRSFFSNSCSIVYNFFFPFLKKKISTFSCSFRIYNVKKFKKYDIVFNDFIGVTELLIKSFQDKINFFEIPGRNYGRKYGHSKMKIIKTIFNHFLLIFYLKFKIHKSIIKKIIL